MRISWNSFLRRVAQLCFVGVATAWSSAMCYAQIAADNAGNPAYADGWQGTTTDHMTGAVETIGDNGGFGFTPWNFDNDFIFHVEGILDMNRPPTQSQYNHLGPAWRMGLNVLSEGKDIVRAGRGLAAPLLVGQTLSIVVDPPAEGVFFDIEEIRLNAGGGSLCYGGAACTPGTTPVTRFKFDIFNWTDFQNWGRWSATSVGFTPLFNVDKAPFEHPDFPQGAAGTDMGLRIDFKLTGADSFDLKLTPLDNPAAVFQTSGFFENPADWDSDRDIDGNDLLIWQRNLGTVYPDNGTGPGDADGDSDVDTDDLTLWQRYFVNEAKTIDWIQFMHYGRTSDPGGSTDFYISSLEVMAASSVAGQASVPEPGTMTNVAGALAGLAGRYLATGRQGRRRNSTR
jgi:hypothetical protein